MRLRWRAFGAPRYARREAARDPDMRVARTYPTRLSGSRVTSCAGRRPATPNTPAAAVYSVVFAAYVACEALAFAGNALMIAPSASPL